MHGKQMQICKFFPYKNLNSTYMEKEKKREKKEGWKDIHERNVHERNVQRMNNVVPFETIYKGYICCQIISS